MSLHKRLRYYRKRNGMTQEYLASALGIGTANYAKYESGERNPKGDRIVALAKVLGISYSTLVNGEEQDAIELLNSHLRNAVLGDISGFSAFVTDFHSMGDVCQTIMEELVDWDELIQDKYSNFYCDFLLQPNLTSLAELDRCYKSASGWFNNQYLEMNDEKPEIQDVHHKFNDKELDDSTIYKMAFCIATSKYINLYENDIGVDFLLSDIRSYTENKNMSDVEAMQSFSVLVFVPFLAHILDTLEFIASNDSNMDDFSLVFLHDGLTMPEVVGETSFE